MASKTKGFTLAEMLIALALIGVIAAMMIPKVLSSTGNKQDVAKMKTLVSTIERAYYEASNDPDYPRAQTETLGVYLQDKMNSSASSIAGSVASTNSGCNLGAANTTWYQFADGTIVVFTGATAVNAGAGNTTVCVDLNANSGGNAVNTSYRGTFTHVAATARKFNWTPIAAPTAATAQNVSRLLNS